MRRARRRRRNRRETATGGGEGGVEASRITSTSVSSGYEHTVTRQTTHNVAQATRHASRTLPTQLPDRFILSKDETLLSIHSCAQRCHVSTTFFRDQLLHEEREYRASSVKRWEPCEILDRAFDPIFIPRLLLFFFFSVTRELSLSTRFRNFCSREREREREQKGKRLKQQMFRTGNDVQQSSLAANFSPCDLCDSRNWRHLVVSL